MNLVNLNRLAQWFEAGAPHCVARMYWIISDVETVAKDEGLTIGEWRIAEGIPEDCGTVCCVAGAAVLMKRSDEQGVPIHEVDFRRTWVDIRSEALEWLGLPDGGGWFAHPLFNDRLAPEGTGAAEMAAAIRRVMAGEHPWRTAE